MLNLHKSNGKKKKGENFFDLSAEDKKRIINAAVSGSNELQVELVKAYNRKFEAKQ